MFIFFDVLLLIPSTVKSKVINSAGVVLFEFFCTMAWSLSDPNANLVKDSGYFERVLLQ